jgi:hypothetical protein
VVAGERVARSQAIGACARNHVITFFSKGLEVERGGSFKERP